MKKPKKITVRLCPACHSKNIRLSSGFNGWLTPEIYICSDCGYRGPVTLEVEISKDEINNKENNKV